MPAMPHPSLPEPALLGLALLLAALAVFGLLRWPQSRAHRMALRGLLLLAAATLASWALLERPATPLTMAECRSTLGGDEALSRAGPPPLQNPPPPLIGLGTGPLGQTYYEFGQTLVALMQPLGVPLVNLETDGSLDNLARMASVLNMAYALVQADALEYASTTQQKLLRVVMPLYQEEVHVLARRTGRDGRALLALRDMDGQRVLVSDRSGGGAYTAGRLLRLANIQAADGKPQPLPPVEAVCRVLVGDAEAMVVVSGQPVGLLRNLQQLVNHPAHPLDLVQFLPLKREDLTARSLPGVSAAFYEPASIERASYPWAFAATSGREREDTLAVRALLMAYDFSPKANPVQAQKCAALRDITRQLNGPAVRARLCQVPHHRKWCQLNPAAHVPGWLPNTCL